MVSLFRQPHPYVGQCQVGYCCREGAKWPALRVPKMVCSDRNRGAQGQDPTESHVENGILRRDGRRPEMIFEVSKDRWVGKFCLRSLSANIYTFPLRGSFHLSCVGQATKYTRLLRGHPESRFSVQGQGTCLTTFHGHRFQRGGMNSLRALPGGLQFCGFLISSA